MTAALAGLRVIDLSTSVSGAWCSRMLADFGAEVVVVEPPGGSPLRKLAPFDGEGRSLLAALLLANKRSAVLDLEQRRDQVKALELVRHADMLVSSAAPASLAASGLTYAEIAQPALIMCHITSHGMTGELRETPGNELTTAARSGWAFINGDAAREPLKPSGWQSSFCAGTAAYAAIMAALHHRNLHPGEGQEVDIAELEVMVSTFAPALLRGQYLGEPWRRRSESDITAGPVPVADGHFSLTISRAHFWRDAMNLLGLTDLAEDPKWEPGHYRAAHKEEYVGRVQEKMLGWKRMDLFEELAARRVIAGPVLYMDELANNPQLRERGFWVRPEGAEDGPEYPGAPFKMSATPWALRGVAPEPGADTAAIGATPAAIGGGE
jgi:crotonobetainyl-CoA:carnitine CoA-transferase CaiB-like acyl-CoA transferase